MNFEEQLKELIAKSSQETGSNDFILAQFIQRMLTAYNIAAAQRASLHEQAR